MSSRKLVSEDTPRRGYTTTIEYENTPEGLFASRIVVESETKPVTATVYHEVKPMELMRKHMRDAPVAKMDIATAKWLIEGGRERLHSLKPSVPKGIDATPVFLQAIRLVYEDAAANGHPTAQAVAKTMNVSIATAGRWIRKSKNELHWG